ncbi:2-keto-3-deoxygalactonate kinase [Nitratireductor aquibiodomus RA22]|uniref:2-keto-3-deoxygalactonate kinase n=1 Tax=Nitratireductor aquibiodomus RA22 TaxID=1189611 RepID=I5BYU1_9HYPH|nr:2-dehydro-3-deoxygalactonokinase [Nitratireductor aquibiodomus]EIM74743.1 2-keto-3-deoxygalactonate kinase [Nitratireductor aquibiodomus RA22]
MTDHSRSFCAAVDWGTSSFRLWLLDDEGTVIASSSSNEGMMHCVGRGFAPVLDAHLAKVGAPARTPVLICGMAGARQGWLEAPYMEVPASLMALSAQAARVSNTEGDVRILPGLSLNDPQAPNVMRGEETQLLGAVGENGNALVCMPGTHSKWVKIENGTVTHFSSFMTGELFSLLTKHGILQHAIEADRAVSADDAAFLSALERTTAQAHAALSGLFGVRAAQLLGFEERADGAAHLSGLLIGGEISAARGLYGEGLEVVLIASHPVDALYRTALERQGFSVALKDAGEASRAGLFNSAKRIWSQ